jgi:hypothetical protein
MLVTMPAYGLTPVRTSDLYLHYGTDFVLIRVQSAPTDWGCEIAALEVIAVETAIQKGTLH